MSLLMSRTFNIKKRMVKDKMSTIPIGAKGIQCLECKYFRHIQDECSSFPRVQRSISNVTNDEKGESNQENNVVTFKEMKEFEHTSVYGDFQ